MMKKIKRLVFSVLVLTLLLTACNSSVPGNTVATSADLAGKSVGVLAGSVSESIMNRYTGMYLKTYSDIRSMVNELKSGGVDCLIVHGEITSKVLKKSSRIRALKTQFINAEYCIAISPENSTLSSAVAGAMRTLNGNKTIDELRDSWMDGEGIRASVPDTGTGDGQALSTLLIAIDPTMYPFCYYDEEGNLTGFETELIRMICQEMGVTPEFREVTYDKLLYMVESGKVSLAIGRIAGGSSDNVTFSTGYYSMVQDIIVRKD